MRFETVSPIEFVKRCRDLFDQNYAEAALPGHQFNLDESAYVQYEKQTPSFAIVAYDGEVLAGFCSVFVSFHQHTSEVMATNDAIFVRPKYRSGVLAGQLFVKAEREAKARRGLPVDCSCPVSSLQGASRTHSKRISSVVPSHVSQEFLAMSKEQSQTDAELARRYLKKRRVTGSQNKEV